MRSCVFIELITASELVIVYVKRRVSFIYSIAEYSGWTFQIVVFPDSITIMWLCSTTISVIFLRLLLLFSEICMCEATYYGFLYTLLGLSRNKIVMMHDLFRSMEWLLQSVFNSK